MAAAVWAAAAPSIAELRGEVGRLGTHVTKHLGGTTKGMSSGAHVVRQLVESRAMGGLGRRARARARLEPGPAGDAARPLGREELSGANGARAAALVKLGAASGAAQTRGGAILHELAARCPR